MSGFCREVHHVEGLWTLSSAAASSSNTTSRNARQKRREDLEYPPLRTKIGIRNTNVKDFPSAKFWTHFTPLLIISNIVVILIVGSLDRDRIDDRSCALYHASFFRAKSLVNIYYKYSFHCLPISSHQNRTLP
jgi:hypothetical protein